MFRASNFTESSTSFQPIEVVMETAARLWTHFKDLGAETREEMANCAYKFAGDIFNAKFGKMPPVFTQLDQREMGLWMIQSIPADWYATWAEYAFPRIEMSHKFAAMLMATKVSEKELEFVAAPWPAFTMQIPDKLLPIRGKDDFLSYITRVHVNTHWMPGITQERWWSLWMEGDRLELFRCGPVEELTRSKPERETDTSFIKINADLPAYERPTPRDAPVGEDLDAFWEAYDENLEDRVSIMVGRLVLGACVMMTQRANYLERPYNARKKLGPFAERLGKRPEGARIYQIGKPVTIDLREAVRAYVEGQGRGPLTTQKVVAGHLKRQPHGPGSSLRKWIIIEPYFQGPVDAPILLRPHVGRGE